MAIADLAAYQALMAAPHQPLSIVKSIGIASSSSVTWSSHWKAVGIPAAGATPTVAAVCDRTTVGALGQQNPSAGALYLALRKCYSHVAAGDNGDGIYKIMIADRLAHIGSMDATVTTPQPTGGMGITRSTNGTGVRAVIEVYSNIGATPTTATISYTNQAGTAGKTSQPIDIGASNRFAGMVLPVSLAVGDSGIRDVASLTLAASTTAAGVIGITLYQPLITISSLSDTGFAIDGDPIKAIAGYLPQIPNDACLWLMVCAHSGNVAGPFIADAICVEA